MSGTEGAAPAAPFSFDGPALLVRRLQTGDIPAIAAIYGESVLTGTASFELEPPDEAEMARRMAALAEAGFPCLAAEIAGEVLGYAYAGPYRPRPGYRYTVEDSVYIARAGRRRGIGRALLRRLIADCEALGHRQMIAVIGDSDNGASIALHASEGFVAAGTLHNVGYKFGRWVDSILMQRPLGPGAAGPPAR